MTPLLYILIGMIIVGIAVFLRQKFAAFYGQKPEFYEDNDPLFDFKKQLNGEMVCEGVIFGPLGRVTSTFVADFNITWEGEVGVMAERFHYNDGTVQDREWRITLDKSTRFSAVADDVPGAGAGMIAGPNVQMLYAIKLPEGSGGHLLKAVDWMYLTRDGTIVNRSQFRKFGFKVAELVATIRHKDNS